MTQRIAQPRPQPRVAASPRPAPRPRAQAPAPFNPVLPGDQLLLSPAGARPSAARAYVGLARVSQPGPNTSYADDQLHDRALQKAFGLAKTTDDFVQVASASPPGQNTS